MNDEYKKTQLIENPDKKKNKYDVLNTVDRVSTIVFKFGIGISSILLSIYLILSFTAFLNQLLS